MNLKMNYNSFIKLKDFFNIEDINIEVGDYDIDNSVLSGNFNVNGKYVKQSNLESIFFSEKIPFIVDFVTKDIEIRDIECIDLEHVEVVGRGIDISVTINVDYDEVVMVPINDSQNVEEVMNKTYIERSNNQQNIKEDIEKIKNDETSRIDKMLESTLSLKEDNLPTTEQIKINKIDNRTRLKVCYFEKSSDLESICLSVGTSLQDVFDQNKKYDIDKYHRVIINGSK